VRAAGAAEYSVAEQRDEIGHTSHARLREDRLDLAAHGADLRAATCGAHGTSRPAGARSAVDAASSAIAAAFRWRTYSAWSTTITARGSASSAAAISGS